MKKLFVILFTCISGVLLGQVNSVDFLMKYNCETNQYDVNLVILEGSATTIPQRAQFNSQISVVVPTGESIEISELNMPRENNQFYDSEVPMLWRFGDPAIAPEAQPESDFHSITPRLSPASFYNDLVAGDEVRLFSLTIGSSGEFDDRVRFYENGVDPTDSDPGMNGGNFSNGFTMGGAMQLYNDNSSEDCTTSTKENEILEGVTYPNPFQNRLTIEYSEEMKEVQIYSVEGEIIYQSNTLQGNKLFIDTDDYPSGIYFVHIASSNSKVIEKVIKI